MNFSKVKELKAKSSLLFKTRRLSFLVPAFVLCFALLPSSASAIELEFHGTGNVDFGFAVWNTTDILLAKAGLSPKLEIFADDFHAVAGMNASYNALKPTTADFSLSEIYAEYAWEYFDFRIGRQLISWGKADGLEITDIICPRDYTKFLGSKYEESRIPTNAIQLRTFGSFYTIEGIWVPVYFSSLPKQDKTNPMNNIFFPSEIETKVGALKASYTLNKTKPKHRIQDGEWGLRASFFFPVIDFSFSAFRGWDHQPNFEASGNVTLPNVALTLTPSYNRIWMAGFDMAIPVDMFIIKAEAAWIGKREFSDKLKNTSMTTFAMPLSKHHQLKALVGMEINPGSGWMINLQYMEDVVFENLDKLKRPQRLPMITAFVSKTLLRETMKISGGIVIGCDAWDTASSLAIGYKIIDDLELSLSGSLYCKGKEDGVFGKMSKLSNIKASLEFSF